MRHIYFVTTERCGTCRKVQERLIFPLQDICEQYTPDTASYQFLRKYHVNKTPMMILAEDGKDPLRCWGDYLLEVTPERVRDWYDHG